MTLPTWHLMFSQSKHAIYMSQFVTVRTTRNLCFYGDANLYEGLPSWINTSIQHEQTHWVDIAGFFFLNNFCTKGRRATAGPGVTTDHATMDRDTKLMNYANLDSLHCSRNKNTSIWPPIFLNRGKTCWMMPRRVQVMNESFQNRRHILPNL